MNGNIVASGFQLLFVIRAWGLAGETKGFSLLGVVDGRHHDSAGGGCHDASRRRGRAEGRRLDHRSACCLRQDAAMAMPFRTRGITRPRVADRITATVGERTDPWTLTNLRVVGTTIEQHAFVPVMSEATSFPTCRWGWPRQRVVLILRDVLGFPAAPVAQILDASEQSVISALKRARAAMPLLPLEFRGRELAERFRTAVSFRAGAASVRNVCPRPTCGDPPPERSDGSHALLRPHLRDDALRQQHTAELRPAANTGEISVERFEFGPIRRKRPVKAVAEHDGPVVFIRFDKAIHAEYPGHMGFAAMLHPPRDVV
ncbi:MAG: sigma factor-like helix-turn-helix DNA-binding protein [Candidatus Baltobacteraceae bacterium]